LGLTRSVYPRKGASVSKLTHGVFSVVVILKGLDGIFEIITGIALLSVQTTTIVALAKILTAHELSEDPRDLIANLLTHLAASVGHSTQMFIAAYLLFHGVAKVTLATFLLMGRLWAYPAALSFFLVFVAYTVYRLSRAWSWPLAGVVILDLITIGLVAKEWRATVGAKQPPQARR